MRLGLTLWADRDVAALARLAACAERTGFDDVWWPDHYMHRDVGATLTACALATERVRLGTAVTSPLLRHPAVLASLFASLAEIAPGRNVLRPRCKYMVGGEFDPSMIPLYGLDPAEVMPVREAVRRGDPAAHELITDEMVDAFSICGSVQRAADRIDALRAAGVSEVILSFGPGINESKIASVGEAMLSFLDR